MTLSIGLNAIDNDQMEKLRMLDRLFNAMSLKDLEELTQQEEVVSKLKGTAGGISPLTDLVAQSQSLTTQVLTLQAEVSTLRNDLYSIVKLMSKPYDYNSSATMESLKSRYNVY